MTIDIKPEWQKFMRHLSINEKGKLFEMLIEFTCNDKFVLKDIDSAPLAIVCEFIFGELNAKRELSLKRSEGGRLGGEKSRKNKGKNNKKQKSIKRNRDDRRFFHFK